MSWFDRLKRGLGKTRDVLTTDVRDLGSVWEMPWDDLEFALIGADTGSKIAAEVVAEAKRERERGVSFREALEKALLDQLEPDRMRQKLRRVGFTLDVTRHTVEVRGSVVMVVGVNGVGKTTTIAKLGQYYTERGRRVMFAAGDTFRAAATAQLEVWGERLGIPTVTGPDGSDPGAVAFNAAQQRRARGYDLLFVDTAGRLHTKHNLMEELKKVKRVIAKADPDEPKEVWLVLDAVTGQNGLAQAKKFHEAVGLTGVIVTKLDGTAKGGILLPIVRELGLPIKFIGVGEKAEDLQPYDAAAYVRALLDMPEPTAA
ncbi:signal recognition particle-docking protein FtsY [Truepera radiovictrix]|uniref:Signal recognition particle receptor FtsY n=1 Tax=Truepera radiovictrix (strain DSM 17093 / CIP 108686 / LMG 22925 / RQ-24) TaxID=649638 RepID=D7CWK6_TRURR|nr:signal recognition particle-docking protein FtsY [Truepera radiovictrix]ADI14405.1 signal recognition particle-docking protein FtsY [Truepera radiovictrix DSM 17093]WMT57038.1 signal recognition particle-docking protein FtsY [Truepera radiovictrix]